MYKIRRTNDYLVHHGILGQKWGKRNGPPYPLDETDKSVKEQKFSSNSKSSNKTEDKNNKKLSDKQKKAIKIGAVIAGTALITGGTIYLYKSGKLSNIGKHVTSKALNGDVGKQILKLEMKSVNPNVSKKYDFLKNIENPINDAHKIAELSNSKCKNGLKFGDTKNCKENALTFFLRKQCGKDVISPARTVEGGLRDFVGKYFNDDPESSVNVIKTSSNIGQKYKGKTAQETATNFIKAQIEKGKYKEGDCGAFGITEKGHTIAFYIEDGIPKFQNIFQDSTSHTATDWFNSVSGDFEFQVCNFANLTPIMEEIRKLYS